jgi:hypothetical protein
MNISALKRRRIGGKLRSAAGTSPWSVPPCRRYQIFLHNMSSEGTIRVMSFLKICFSASPTL